MSTLNSFKTFKYMLCNWINYIAGSGPRGGSGNHGWDNPHYSIVVEIPETWATTCYAPWHQQQNGYPNNKEVYNTWVRVCVITHTNTCRSVVAHCRAKLSGRARQRKGRSLAPYDDIWGPIPNQHAWASILSKASRIPFTRFTPNASFISGGPQAG